MNKNNTFVLLISIAVGITIITVISFFIVWLCFPTDTPKDSFKDALGFMGGIFGGLTTFGAAIVAVHLFNDWKVQHNKQVINNFGLQVYEQFSNFEKDLSIYHQCLEQLDDLIDSYEWEVNSTMLHTDNNLHYISNITNKMRELKISFNSLYSKFQSYSIVLGTLNEDYIRHNGYLDTFKDNNSFDDEIFIVRENLNTWYENYNETLALTNQIRTSEIEKLLINLKAK
ncbi:hypothetical protein D3C78_403360 [compost metagenome]